jgi:hypothetical protein
MTKPIVSDGRRPHSNRHQLFETDLKYLLPGDVPPDVTVNVEVWYDTKAHRVCMSVAAIYPEHAGVTSRTKKQRGTVAKYKADVRKIVARLKDI